MDEFDYLAPGLRQAHELVRALRCAGRAYGNLRPRSGVDVERARSRYATALERLLETIKSATTR